MLTEPGNAEIRHGIPVRNSGKRRLYRKCVTLISTSLKNQKKNVRYTRKPTVPDRQKPSCNPPDGRVAEGFCQCITGAP